MIAVGGLLFAMLIFGGYFVAGRHGALAGLDSADLLTLRYAIPGVLFAPLLLRHGLKQFGGVGWARGVALTLFGGGPYSFAVLVGLYFSSAVHGAVINPGLTPIASVLLSRAILDERPPLGAVAGIPVTLVGIVLVAGAGLWSRGSGTWVGDAILAANAVSYGLVTVLLRRWRIAPVPATAAINVLSAVVWVPCYGVLTGLRPLLAAPIEETIGQAIFLGGFAGGVTGLLYVHGIHVLGPSQAAQFQALVPVFGTLLAAGLLGEHLSMLQWTGIAAVVIGMLTAA